MIPWPPETPETATVAMAFLGITTGAIAIATETAATAKTMKTIPEAHTTMAAQPIVSGEATGMYIGTVI